jgi:hypothetical protein
MLLTRSMLGSPHSTCHAISFLCTQGALPTASIVRSRHLADRDSPFRGKLALASAEFRSAANSFWTCKVCALSSSRYDFDLSIDCSSVVCPTGCGCSC